MTNVEGGSQAQYQVRFDWGVVGADAICADADVVVAVRVLGDVAEFGRRLGPGSAVVVAGGLTNAAAVARWALEQQGEKGDRFRIAVVACGAVRVDGSLRFALEDLLGAGAVIEALAEVGIDYYSPEAAAAAAAFTGLRNGTAHLIAASDSGRRMVAEGRRAELDAALDRNVVSEVPILREFSSGA